MVVPISAHITGPESVPDGRDSDPENEMICVLNAASPKHLPHPVQIVHLVPFFIPVYNITDRIGIGTGLSRTSLSSNIHSGTSTMYTDSEQKMVLLGIPISLYYGIPLSAKWLEVYASVGGMWEKAVDYSLDSHEYIGGQKTSAKSHSEEVPSYNQWSVNAVAGVRISLSEKSAWSVFAEGGAVRHFDNGSEIPTIYNDKPLIYYFAKGENLRQITSLWYDFRKARRLQRLTLF